MPEKHRGFTPEIEANCVQALVDFLDNLKTTKNVKIDTVNQSILSYMVRTCYEFEIINQIEVLVMSWFNNTGDKCELSLGKKSSLTDKYWAANAATAAIRVSSLKPDGTDKESKLRYMIPDIKIVNMFEFAPDRLGQPNFTLVLKGDDRVVSDNHPLEATKATSFERHISIGTGLLIAANPSIHMVGENFRYTTSILPRR